MNTMPVTAIATVRAATAALSAQREAMKLDDYSALPDLAEELYGLSFVLSQACGDATTKCDTLAEYVAAEHACTNVHSVETQRRAAFDAVQAAAKLLLRATQIQLTIA